MKKRLLLVGLVLSCTSAVSYGQLQSTTGHTAPQSVVAIPSLNTQLEKIHQKELQVQQAGASSRAQLAEIRQELTVLQNDYKNLLTKEIATCAVDHVRAELQTELLYIEQQLTPASNVTPASRTTINPNF
jgi:ABC-type phosphate transport system auxiliary subunit